VRSSQLIGILFANILFFVGGYFLQKRALEKRVKHLKKQVEELENLVAAMIEEFETVAGIDPESLEPVEEEHSTSAQPFEASGEMESLLPNPSAASLALEIDRAEELQPDQTGVTGVDADKPGDFPGDYRQRIYQLWQAGESVAHIAKQLNTGQGEVELALKFYKRS
jgi:hypothetical protein